MKLSVYDPQVKLNNINGEVKAYDTGQTGAMQARALQGLAGGIGVVAKVVQRQQEETDAINAQAAANDYTKRLNELMYNQDNGLMNKKFQAADGITTTFEEQERQIRQDVASQYKFNTRKGELVFQNMANNSATQRFEMVRKHQTQQYFAFKDLTYANAKELNMQTAANNYTSMDIVDDNVREAAASAAAQYYGQGEEVVQMHSRRAAGDVALYTINYALNAGDLDTASVLLDKYAGVIDTSKLPGLVGNIRVQRENNFMVDAAKMLAHSNLKGPQLEAAIENIRTPGSTGNYQGLKRMMDATLGQPYKLGTDGSNGTWDCGLWTQTMLNNNGENIRVRTADGQYAQMESEGRAFKDKNNLKPGDLVFWHTTDRWKYTDNPNAGADEAYKGITHVGIYVGDGKVRQAGNSGVSDIALDDYKVIGFGRTNMGIPEEGRSLDSVQKSRLASMVYSERQKMKSIEAERQKEMLVAAQDRFRADGPYADPDAIAQEIAGDDVKMKNTISQMLTDAKYKIEQKGISDGAMNTVFRMIKDGQFDSMADAIRFVQVPGRKANTKQINQIEQWWDDKLNLKGRFKYPNLDRYISTAVAGEKDQGKKLLLADRLGNYAEDFINEYRRLNNGQDPTPEELQKALSKDYTEKKLVATTAGGEKYEYTPLMMSDNKIVSAVPYGDGMMKVVFRDYNPNYRGREVLMPTQQFADYVGLKAGTNWNQLISNPWLTGPLLPGSAITTSNYLIDNYLIDFINE